MTTRGSRFFGGTPARAWLLCLPILATCAGGTRPHKLPFPNARWVAYSPTEFDPTTGLRPTETSLLKDLQSLRDAGFTGLVTYGCDASVIGLPRLARRSGFTSFIQGIWSPTNEQELKCAEALASDVTAYCVGNEGLIPGGRGRYSLVEVQAAIAHLRKNTGKPVTTTEEVDDYFRDPQLLVIGDWVFPNVHPYWQGIRNATGAVEWTMAQYDELVRRSAGRAILLKEVGMPSEGGGGVNESLQSDFYRLLAQTRVRFVYFEAFDQRWKRHAPVEPYWGLFRADRTPKQVVGTLGKE